MTDRAVKVTYILVLHLPEQRRMNVGRLGTVAFKPGIYFYVGSGGRSPLKRIVRHIKKSKRKHWHIDFLTVQSKVIGAFILEADISLECALARCLAGCFEPVGGFGSSDCRCGSHLFFAGAQGKEV